MREFAAHHIPKPELPPLDLSSPHLDLEIGAGQGLHAIHYAKQHPDRHLIAIEKTHSRFAQLEQRALNHKDLQNLKIFHADAVALISHFIAPETLARVFLLYPCPYPKAKQANLRWHNRPFLKNLLEKMKPQAELTVATNLEWYAQEARKAYSEQWSLEVLEFQPVANTATPRTHFEKKYLARNETCWNLRFRKR